MSTTVPTLTTPSLFREQAYLNGAWASASNGATIPVENPATREVIGHVPNLDDATVQSAITAAHAAFPAWSKTLPRERSNLMRKWHSLMLKHAEDLATLLTLEQGKPLSESRTEIAYAASFIEWFAEEGPRIAGEIPTSTKPGQRMLVLRQSVGVAAAITPWNFPSAMVTRKIAPAIAAGCPVLLKPAELTPFSALALAALAEEAGIPKGVFSVLTGDSARIGPAFTGDARIRKLSFTGSTRVGKLLASASADNLKRLSLELGGNAPFIVFNDANLEDAANALMACKFRNAGQTCVCANRVLVEDGVYDKFLSVFAPKVAALKLGSGLEAGVTIGPLITKLAQEKVNRLTSDAEKKGAKRETSASPSAPDLPGYFCAPAIYTDADAKMDMFHEEIFGPIAPLTRFKGEEEAVKLANATPYGLASYVFTNDHKRIWRVAEGLEYGMVGVNEGYVSNPVAPFGGVKESGYGREGSIHGIDEYLEYKYVCLGGIA
ncbi:MAG: NAD-dependent succinate-semialdehyde dehydrogenase [Alphaproteobacteria bacterium]|nr:NAD-dependent succinate-semialdehyde dehydrogenase [Alphaproteobacteria bacterium]